MIDPNQLRQRVRAVLAAAGRDQRLCEAYIHAALARFFPEPVPVPAMMEALRFNADRGWAEKFWNDDEQRDEWQLTGRGRIKEGLA